MKPVVIKQKAISYRKKGYSYSMINKILKLPKSTLSGWLKDIEFIPNEEVLQRVGLCIKKLTIYSQKKALERQKIRKGIQYKGKEQIKKLSLENLRFVGAILYLAEGGKKQKEVKLTNSDPRVIRLTINWLTQVCGVSINDIQARVHMYPDNSETKSISYWSEISKIPKNQFQKTQVDTRIKKSKYKHGLLPYGTLHIRVRKSCDLYHKIMGWVDGILEKSEQLTAGIL